MLWLRNYSLLSLLKDVTPTRGKFVNEQIYVYMCLLCQSSKHAVGHLASEGFPARLCLFLPSVSHFVQWFLMEGTTWGPTTVATGTCRPLISHRYIFFVVLPTLGKGCSGLELRRGSAYSSGRAQGNLYATQPAHPPLLAQAKNSQ